MNPRALTFAAVGASAALASGDPAPQPQVQLTEGTLNTWDLEWQSVPVRTYFMQLSEDLAGWEYVPVIEFGDGFNLAWGFESSAAVEFFRLKYTDIPTTDPDLADFDGDGVGSLLELKVLGTDPLVYATNGSTPDGAGDSDGDGIPDALELLLHGNLTTMNATSDQDGDGILDLYEVQAGEDPQDDQTAEISGRSNFIYDSMGRLTGVTGSEERSYSFDTESNYEAIQER